MGFSLGGLVGGVLGGAAGFVGSGFNPVGAVAGASAGYGLGKSITAKGPAAANNKPIDYSRYNTQLDPAKQEELRRRQLELINALQAQQSGAAPSVAQQQLQMGQENAFKQALALQASQRGRVNPFLAQRQLQTGFAQGQSNLNQQLGLLRAQEQAGVNQTLAQALGQARSQDIGFAQGNQAGQLQAMGLASGDENERRRIQAMIQEANAQRQNNFLGGLISAGGAIASQGISSGAFGDFGQSSKMFPKTNVAGTPGEYRSSAY